jgi:alpha,alpha-trehalose phosphorylase
VEALWTPAFADRVETAFALSNGYVGVGGALDEGRPSLAPGTSVNGFHETWPIIHAEEPTASPKPARRSATSPDAMVVELFVDDEPLFVPTARLRDYARVLDMRSEP